MIRHVLEVAVHLVAAVALFAVLLYIVVAAVKGRTMDPKKGQYRDKNRIPYEELNATQRRNLLKRYGW